MAIHLERLFAHIYLCGTKEQVEVQISFQLTLSPPLYWALGIHWRVRPALLRSNTHRIVQEMEVDRPFTTIGKCLDEGQPTGHTAPQKGST